MNKVMVRAIVAAVASWERNEVEVGSCELFEDLTLFRYAAWAHCWHH